jgi:hypothetical protein
MFGMTPHGIPKEEKILKNTVSRNIVAMLLWDEVMLSL